MAKSTTDGGSTKKAPSAAKKPVASKKKTAASTSSASAKAAAPKKAIRKPAAPASSAPTAKKRPTKTKATAAKGSSAPAKADASKAATPSANKPAKSPFNEKFLVQQRKALLEERATYTRQAFNLQAEADSLVADFEPGDVQFDEESGEGDTLNIERERDLALSAQAKAQVEEIDHALAKFELGTYGICEVSGEPVPEERLEAIPWARQRVQYKTGGIGRH